MISRKSEFRLFDRGFKDNIVLIPGWATDYRIFLKLNLNYNYVLPIQFYPFDFEKRLLKYLDKISAGKVLLFGWSLGGFSATDFALKNSQRVSKLILLSIRKGYHSQELKEIELKLKRNRKAYLYRFYLECFSSYDKEGLGWFKENLLKRYISEMKLEDLLCGLDYLSNAKLHLEFLASVQKLRIFHGKEDKIAPLKEAIEIKSRLPCAKFTCFSNLGHVIFLNSEFTEKFHNG